MVLFVCDAMLGELARWFRILGFPALYVPNDWDDDEVLRVLSARRGDNAVLVTRDRRLHQRARKQDHASVMLTLDTPTEDALRQALIAANVTVDEKRLFSLCSLCGAALRDATPSEIAAAPERVQARQDDFKTCTSCGQVYWKGTHWEGIRRMFHALTSGS